MLGEEGGQGDGPGLLHADDERIRQSPLLSIGLHGGFRLGNRDLFFISIALG